MPAQGVAAGRRLAVLDSAGVFGAIAAALCCAGTPFIVGAMTAAGLGFLRSDAILWPVMLVCLGVAIWRFELGRRVHRQQGPLVIGTVGAVSLACGVIVVHGPPAMQMIYGGAIVLVAATIWNIRACGARTLPARPY